MNLSSIVEYCTTHSIDQFFKNYTRICFSSESYPLLFFLQLLQKAKKNRLSLQYLDLKQFEYAQIIAQLELMFLAQSKLYWLGDISSADNRIDKKMEQYLLQYDGPNTVLFFSTTKNDKQDTATAITFEIPHQVTQADGVLLARLLGYDSSTYLRFMQELFKHTKTVELDMFCLLLEYGCLLAGDTQQFFKEYFHMLVAPQQSLFTLSQYFFAKQEKQFFSYWAQVHNAYSPLFWCSFWSEQLWRAYHYISFMQCGNNAAARTISFRLPFSFLKKDWQSLTVKEIHIAHEKIYAIDHAIKNGADQYILDLFYTTFFFGL